ncbi:hypothetical protein O6H91_09G021900 [Diphasiastrum complanatum]|uniref:Uncharacterized protein n=1 Tax=Diphasiastrum complanatum TaxID=34168 RepID=A0ACC2CM03_DIPCM|nr:hypothetical protein O6H91_09G021900 [Diphasiastrum complanatum]
MIVMDMAAAPLTQTPFSRAAGERFFLSQQNRVQDAVFWGGNRAEVKKQQGFRRGSVVVRKSLNPHRAGFASLYSSFGISKHVSFLAAGFRHYDLRRLCVRALDEDDDSGPPLVNTSWNSLPPGTDELLQHLAKEAVRQPLSGYEEPIATKTQGQLASGIGLEEGYVGLFVRMLGLDKSAEEREEAVQALWRHSAAGKEHVDEIVGFPGCLTLVVTLLSSKRPATSEAAAGLLRNISAIHSYTSLVVDAGAIEEIAGLLSRRTAPPEVREQATCVLWNLSVEESYSRKIGKLELLLVLLTMLDSSQQGEIEAAAGVLSNVALSKSNHSMLMDAGAIPKLAKLLKDDTNVSKISRQEARNALLELIKNEDTKLAVLEEGLVPVPLIGAAAYRSFKPHLQQAPSIPENTKLEQPPQRLDSTFGAGELLLGLKIGNESPDLDNSTKLAVEGRIRQHFLARIGVIERDYGDKGNSRPLNDCKITLMPWWDGIPRLILILGLEDVQYARRAADSISDIAFSEENRQAVAKAGGIPHLVRLLGCGDEAATEAVASAIEKLACSHKVRKSIDAHGAVPALVAILKAEDAPQTVKEKVVAALLRLSQTGDEIKAMLQAGAVPGLLEMMRSQNSPTEAKNEAEEILEEISNLNAEPRDKIVVADGIAPLIDIMLRGSPSLKEKAASVLENLATKEAHALEIIRTGIDHVFKEVFEVNMDGVGDEIHDPKNQDTWLAVSASSRLLEKLLRFPGTAKFLNIPYLVEVLKRILRAETPLHVKDWASACLLRLSRNAISATEIQVPVDLEVTVHDIIPRLVEEIRVLSAEVQERAVLQLRDLVTEGIQDYAAAVANSGGIFPLVQVLHKGTPTARAATVSILYSLSMNDENHPAILAAGAVPFLERVVRTEAVEWKLALYLLRALPT